MQQRNGELAQALPQAHLLILAQHTLIEVGGASAATAYPKKACYQTALQLQENAIVRVSVGHLHRLFGVSR